MDNKEKIALIKAGTDIKAIRDNMFLLSNRVRILEAAQKNGETPVTIDNNRSDLIAEMEKTATGYIRAGYLGTGTQIREWVRQLSTCG